MRIPQLFTVLLCLGATSLHARPLDQDYPYLEALYKHLHQNPELSFLEKESSKRLAHELRELGFTVTENFGGYGMVGILKNGPGPTVLIRTDTDALPVEEATDKSYASHVKQQNLEGKTVPVMHACGHDIHMTVFTGTARQLVDQKDKWQGTLVLIGQAAEEQGGGAKAMIDAGLFKKFPRPDYNLALHVTAELPAGEVAYTPGYAMANVDTVDMKIFGEGGHGAYPHKTKDPIVLASQIILALQTIVSRETAPTDAAVVTVGSIHGGTQHNIIPDQVDLQLTLRSYTPEVRSHSIEAIKRISSGLAAAAGLTKVKFPVITVRDNFTPSVYNDPELTRKVSQILIKTLGENRVKQLPPVMGGEDFGRYGREDPKIPSVIYGLGSVDPALVKKAEAGDQKLPSLHSSGYAPLPEPTIKTGVRVMTAVALDLLQKKPVN